MKTYLSIILGICVILSCGQRNEESTDEASSADTSLLQSEKEEEKEMYSYTDTNYHFSIDIPSSWKVYTSRNGQDIPVINIYDPRNVENKDLPLNIHSAVGVSHISFYPKGLAMELPFGQHTNWKNAKDQPSMNIPVQKESSYIYYLKNEDIWAYFIRPVVPPASWSKDGYIFSRLAIEQFESLCYEEESQKMISIKECDPYIGDSIVYKGNVDSSVSRKMERCLESIEFLPVNEAVQKEMIQVEYPKEGQSVSSPLELKGKARGYWYFEADFPVELKDMEGNTLVRTYASAKGEWMTEDFVPFESKLTFDAGSAEKGVLILHRANPSDLPENDRSITIPVNFE